MKILYATNVCSKEEFKRIFDMCSIKPLQSIQKFNELFCSGMAHDESIDLEVITSAPINRKMCKKVFWKQKKEEIDNINYNYCFMINLPIIKFIALFFSSIFTVIQWCKKNKKEEKVVIYDAYCPIIANVAAIIGNMYGAKVIALYTDVPKCMNDNLNKKNGFKNFLKNIYNSIDKKSNDIAKGYILLTEQMNEVVNKDNKPYIVMEGLVDSNFNIENNLENKYEKFTILYAGGLYSKFGIENLIKAVEEIKEENLQLLLYGEGELVEILKNDYKNSTKIIYGGTLPNHLIVKKEVKSTILINPRFSNEEYTKYSFPSKNMEYMVSGTPLLTTKLPGIPKEYDKYVYYIEEETVKGLKNIIEQLMKKDRKELYKKGKEAQKFVLENKNNYIQGKRALKFIQIIGEK